MRGGEEQATHPAIQVALGMTLFVALSVALAFRPWLGGVDEPRVAQPGVAARESVETELQPEIAPVRQAPPPRALVEQPARFVQGVKLELQTADGSRRDARSERLVALHVPRGQSPSVFLPAGPFTARWSGQLNVGLRDRFVFTFEGRGGFVLTVNGERVLEVPPESEGAVASPRVSLRQGRNELVAEYQSPAEGDATARLLWESFEFPREPVPPMVWTHNAEELVLSEGGRLRRGRQLLVEGRCVRCHATGGAVSPEFVMDAPSFVEMGARLSPHWMAAWIENPKAMRPDAQMPRLLHGPTAGQDAADIAVYLGTLKSAPEKAAGEASATGGLAAGVKVYGSLGCVGCHTLEEAQDGRIGLQAVGEKYTPHGLREYLMEPSRYYAWSRMPDFKLSSHEVAALAELLESTGPEAHARPPMVGDAARGRELVETLGCVNCHSAPVANRFATADLASVRGSSGARGCMAADEYGRGRAPDFGFSDADRDALQAVAQADPAFIARTVAAEFASERVVSLRCDACHRMDGRLDRWSSLSQELLNMFDRYGVEPEEHGVDATRPHLTYAGEKLRGDYLARLLAGEGEPARPWLSARMPAFRTHAHALAEGLAAAHGMEPDSSREAESFAAESDRVNLGARLITKQHGFGCVDCHAVGEQKAQAVFEAEGVDLLLAPQRLRRAWYDRWMLHPLRIEPGTKMPRYADEHGLTPLPEFGGDGAEQFQAIWEYLASRPPGAKLQ